MRTVRSLAVLMLFVSCLAVPASAQTTPDLVLSGLSGGLATIVFSPDGKSIAAAGDYYRGDQIFGGVIGMWDTETGAPKTYIEIHPFQAFSLAYSPDGATLAVGTHPEIRFFDTATGKQKKTLKMSGGVSRVAYSRDGKVLAATVGMGTAEVKAWDTATDKPLLSWQQQGAWLHGMGLTDDGKTLAVLVQIGAQKAICTWDVPTGAAKRQVPVPANHMASGFCVSPDGKLAAMADAFGVILVDTETGKVVRTLKKPAGRLAFSPDGKVLASYFTTDVTLWDVESGAIRAVLRPNEHAQGFRFSDDGKLFAAGGGQTHKSGDVYLWRLNLPPLEEERAEAAPPKATDPETQPAPGEAGGQSAGVPELDPGKGEVRLEGTITAVNAEAKRVALRATTYMAAGGQPAKLDPPREKKVVLTAGTRLVVPGADSRPLMPGDLPVGAALVAVGKDLGPGKPLTARAVRVAPN